MQYKVTPDIYKWNDGARFVLGLRGEKPLIVFGINPSFADNLNPDRTINKVIRFAHKNNFEGWIMLNIYPLRDKNPKNLRSQFDEKLHRENIKCISEVLFDYPNADICAAWGVNINIRPYLKECLREICRPNEMSGRSWKSIGPLSKDGHPKHPLYLSSSLSLMDFDIQSYLNK